MKNLGIPQGMRDILTDESSKRSILQEKLRSYMQCCGFNQIETPLFEYYELFSGDMSPIADESIIKTIDRDGKVVALRPDMTIPTARIVATKLKGEQKPLKLFYIGNVYRMNRKNHDAAREFFQIGAEIYGSTGKWADIELISMARECVDEAGVADYKIDIGHMGIIKGIFKELEIPEDKKAAIIALVGEKNLVELGKEVSCLEISDKSKDIICKLPCLFGSPEDIFEKIDEIIINSMVKEAVDYLAEVYEKCRAMGLAPNLTIDAGMSGNMEYYTGLVFKAYARGASRAVVSGGRYDDLLGVLGSGCPAAGFAIDIDSMLKAAALTDAKSEKEHKVLVIFSDCRFPEALEYSKTRRKSGGIINLINSRDIENAERYREQYGYAEIVKFE